MLDKIYNPTYTFLQLESSKVVMSLEEETAVENLLKKKSSITGNVIGASSTEVAKPLERKKRKASGANPLSNMKSSGDSNSAKKKKSNQFKRS